MTTQYVFIFFALLVVALGFYFIYERLLRPRRRAESSLYVEALRDLLDGRPESAFTKLRQVVAQDTNNIDAYLRLAQILREHNKPDRALQVHKDLTLRVGLPVEQKVAILRQLAADYREMGELDTAQAALVELTSLKPDDRVGFAELLRIQRDLREWEKAYQTATQMLKLEGNKSKKPLAVYKYQMGKELEQKGEHRKARVLFKEALNHDSKFSPSYLAIGDSYLAEDRREDAVNFWNKLIENVPEEGHRAIERLKKVMFDLGRFGDIAETCERILNHNPDDLKARTTLAEFYRKKGDLDQAENLLKRIVSEDAGNQEALMELISLYVEGGDIKKIGRLLRDLETSRQNGRDSGGDSVVDTTLIGLR